MGQKKRVVGQKRRVVGQKRRVVGQKRRVGGQKRRVVGQKRRVVGQKRRVVGQKRRVVGQKKRIVGQKKRVVGQKKRNPDDDLAVQFCSNKRSLYEPVLSTGVQWCTVLSVLVFSDVFKKSMCSRFFDPGCTDSCGYMWLSQSLVGRLGLTLRQVRPQRRRSRGRRSFGGWGRGISMVCPEYCGICLH